MMRPDRLTPVAPAPNAPVVAPQARPGFVLRPQTPRTAMQMTTDKWLRRLGVATFAVVGLGAALLGAPTMLDLSNVLMKSAVSVIAAPAPLDPPAAPSLLMPPALALPATPDISSDVTPAAGEVAVPGGTVPR